MQVRDHPRYNDPIVQELKKLNRRGRLKWHDLLDKPVLLDLPVLRSIPSKDDRARASFDLLSQKIGSLEADRQIYCRVRLGFGTRGTWEDPEQLSADSRRAKLGTKLLKSDHQLRIFELDSYGELADQLRSAGQLPDRPAMTTTLVPSLRLSKIQALIASARLPEARSALTVLISEDAPLSADRIEALTLLGCLMVDSGDIETGLIHLLQGRDEAEEINDPARGTRCIELAAQRLVAREETQRAEILVKDALKRMPGNTSLWRRLGIVQWYSGSLLSAYASLTTALTLGHPRSHILHARGQVLAELEWFAQARPELEEALGAALTPVSRAYVLGAHAWTIGCMGENELARREFEQAESAIPDSAWLAFRKARWLDFIREHSLAREAYMRALALKGPPLTKVQRELAETRMGATTQAEGRAVALEGNAAES